MKGVICPSILALHHPATEKLLQYNTKGCPTESRKLWSVDTIEAVVLRGPHVSAMEPEATKLVAAKVSRKEKHNQVKMVNCSCCSVSTSLKIPLVEDAL